MRSETQGQFIRGGDVMVAVMRLASSKGWKGTGTHSMPSVRALPVSVPLQAVLTSGLLQCPYNSVAGSPEQWAKKEQSRGHDAFHDWTFEITHYPIGCTGWPVECGRRLHNQMDTKNWEYWRSVYSLATSTVILEKENNDQIQESKDSYNSYADLPQGHHCQWPLLFAIVQSL